MGHICILRLHCRHLTLEWTLSLNWRWLRRLHMHACGIKCMQPMTQLEQSSIQSLQHCNTNVPRTCIIRHLTTTPWGHAGKTILQDRLASVQQMTDKIQNSILKSQMDLASSNLTSSSTLYSCMRTAGYHPVHSDALIPKGGFISCCTWQQCRRCSWQSSPPGRRQSGHGRLCSAGSSVIR